MRNQIMSQSLIEIGPESESFVLRIGAIGPDEVTDWFFFDLLDQFIRHFAGGYDARSKGVDACRAVRSRKEKQAGVFGEGKPLFAKGILLLHRMEAICVLLPKSSAAGDLPPF